MSAESYISPEDRRAAAAVTTSQSGHRFEIQLGHLCNNRCVFCSSGQLTALKIARPVPIEPIIEALEQARAAGATHLTFLGGEPTIHKRFLEALQKAVELGFGHIVIFTNGVMFPHPGFIDSVTALGNFEWRISIQGATDEAHVATTGRADSFRRIVHGLGELQRRGQLVTTNMCVNERSYRSLPHYPELLSQYGVRQLHVDIVRPESTGERDEAYLRDIMPRYSDMAPYYDEMLAGFERSNPDFDVNVGNLPYCVLPQWASRIHHGGQATVTKSSDGEGLEDEMNKYEWQSSLRTYLPTCDPCIFRTRCTGIFRGYLELHGGEEFQPIGLEQLASLPGSERNFVLLTQPALEPLKAALGQGDLPPSWQIQHEVSEDRQRRIEFVFRHRQGATARLTFLPAGQAGSAVLQTPRFDLEAEAEIAVEPEAIDQLLSWVRQQLALAVPDLPHLELDAAERCLRGALMQRARRRVQLLARRLQNRFAVDGWQLGALRWPSEGAAELVARGPGTDELTMQFTLATRGHRSHVGVDFRTAGKDEKVRLQPIVEQLVGLLRDGDGARRNTRALDA